MKFFLLKDLPLVEKGDVFQKGSWTGGGWGIDLGKSSVGAHRGIKTFKEHENKVLDDMVKKCNPEWVACIGETPSEMVKLYDIGMVSRDALILFIEQIPQSKKESG